MDEPVYVDGDEIELVSSLTQESTLNELISLSDLADIDRRSETNYEHQRLMIYADVDLGGLRQKERETDLEEVDKAVEKVCRLAPEIMEKCADDEQKVAEELEQQTELLETLKRRIQDQNSIMKDLQYQLAEINKNYMLAQFGSYKTERNSTLLQKEIDGYLTEVGKKEVDLVGRRSRRIDQEKKIGEYRSRMSAHKERIAVLERRLPARVELQEVSQEIDHLEKEIESLTKCDDFSVKELLEAGCQSRLEEEIDTLTSEQMELEQLVDSAQKTMTEEEARIGQLQLDCDVLKKRNAAQLKRLHSQVREMQSRDQYWSDQCAQIRVTIDQVREQQH